MAEHPLKIFEEIDPELLKLIQNTNALALGEGALPKKFKLLIAMAFDAAHGAVLGVRALAQQAMKEGATEAEIAETLRVAYHLAGVGTLYAASAGLKDILG